MPIHISFMNYFNVGYYIPTIYIVRLHAFVKVIYASYFVICRLVVLRISFNYYSFSEADIYSAYR